MSEYRQGGVARERTALAWGRSALSFVVVAALVLRFGLETGQAVLGTVVGGGLLGVAALVWRFGRTAEGTRAERSGASVALPRTLGALALATTAAGLAATVLALRA